MYRSGLRMVEVLGADFVPYLTLDVHDAIAMSTDPWPRVQVSTVRLPVTDNVANLLQCVDVDTAAVLFGKQYVCDVMDGLPGAF